MQDGCLGSWLPPSRGEHRAVRVLKKQKRGKHALPQAFHGLLCCGLCLIKYSWEGTSKTANSHPYFKNENTTTQRPRRSFSLYIWGWCFSSCFWTLEKTWFPSTCSDGGQRSFEELSESVLLTLCLKIHGFRTAVLSQKCHGDFQHFLWETGQASSSLTCRMLTSLSPRSEHIL